MKLYQAWLIILRLAMIIQVTLIFARVQPEEHVSYLITDILFKTSLGIFLIIYFYINGTTSFDNWDEVFIGFGGGILIFDAWSIVFPKLLRKYNIYFNPYTFKWSGDASKIP